MNVNDILIRVKRQFGDESGVQISNEDIYRWITDAQQEIAIAQNLLQTTATSDIVGGQWEYTLPSDTLTLRSVLVGGKKVKVYSLQEAEAWVENIDDPSKWVSGEPVGAWIWANTLVLYPKPESSIDEGLKVRYTKSPDPITDSVQELELSRLYHNRVVEYCLTQAYELDEDWPAVEQKSAQYAAGIQAQSEAESWTERTSYPTITILPEDY